MKPTIARKSDIAQQWLHSTLELYHQNLLQSSQAKAYLSQRGLAHSGLIDTFKLGYAQKNLGTILPSRTSQAGKDTRDLLKEVGITLQSGIERFSGSIVMPIMHNDNIQEVYGRKVAPANKLRPGTAKHLYLPGAHKGMFNQQGVMDAARDGQDTVILCEALIDAMSFWVHGFKHVTSSYGVHGFSSEQLGLFHDIGIKRVLIAYDNDEAGNHAALNLVEPLAKYGISTWRVQLPTTQDVNAYMVASSQPANDLERLLTQAIALNKTPVASASTSPQPPESPEPMDDASTLQASQSMTPEPLKKEQRGQDIHISLGNRDYRVRGLSKKPQGQQLKINLMLRVVSSQNDNIYIDSLDLYHSKQRQSFISQAHVECGVGEQVIKQDLSRILLALEEEQSQQDDKSDDVPQMSEAEKADAIALLKQPDLLNMIINDFSDCGVVGEQSNTLVGYLACVSRKLDKPLALVIQSSSAAGKSALMDAILAMCPNEDVTQFSAMTGQSLFYMQGASLKHRILAISEEEGASQAAYALKLLQSQGVLTMASTGKDPITGQLVTQTYEVEGPTMLFLTTTAIDVDEELMNRCLVLSVNESREQTQHIHALQRKRRTLQGLLQHTQKSYILKRHQHAQRLLRPLHVVNPFAEELTFMDDKTRTRRDHEKYLTLIDTIALLHQYQREVKRVAHPHNKGETMEYVEVTKADIHCANELAHNTLGRSLDELPAQTRKLLNHAMDWVTCQAKIEDISHAAVRFTRKQLRDATGWSDTALKVHLARLVDMEYMLVHLNGHRQRYHYELLYQGEREGASMLKLMDVAQTAQTTPDRSGQEQHRSGHGQAVVSVLSGAGQTPEKPAQPNDTNGHEVATLPKDTPIRIHAPQVKNTTAAKV